MISSLPDLNEQYRSLSPEKRIVSLFLDFPKEEILLTSSFGTTAVYLLHLFAKQNLQLPVHFIDTRFHFQETILYKNKLQKLLDLEVVDVQGAHWKYEMSVQEKLWESHPDLCCTVNKVEPLAEIKKRHHVWISGLMAWQSERRESLPIFEEKGDMLKFYPIIDVEAQEIEAYLRDHQLPVHPLKPLGYESVGCKYCTVKGSKRSGRWQGQAKNECGLHD